MTTSSSGVATLRDIDESQELQDRDIKKEFRMMRIYIDKRFEEQRSYVDGRFQQIDDRFQQVDDRFQDLEVLMKNSRAASGWHNIFPVRVQNSTPPSFPNKVIKFWHLQRPRKQPQLVELLRFYGIRASDLTPAIFEDDDDDVESKNSFESSSTFERVTLEEAVKANPAFALARLAEQIGLDYGNISHNMGLYDRIQEVRAQQEAQRTKREHSEEDKGKDVARPTKKTAMSEIIQAQRRSPRIPIEMLLPGSDDIFASESPQPQSYVGWAPPSLPLRAPASSSSKKAGDSPPSQPSKDTIPFTHTPSVPTEQQRDVTLMPDTTLDMTPDTALDMMLDTTLDKTPGAKRGKTPGAKRGKTPGAERGKTPGAERGKTPGAERGKTPGAKRGKTPGAKRGKSPGAI